MTFYQQLRDDYPTMRIQLDTLQQLYEANQAEFKRLKAKLIHIYNKYSKNVRISAIFDKGMILPYKASPIDRGPQIFEKLLNERIIPYE